VTLFARSISPHERRKEREREREKERERETDQEEENSGVLLAVQLFRREVCWLLGLDAAVFAGKRVCFALLESFDWAEEGLLPTRGTHAAHDEYHRNENHTICFLFLPSPHTKQTENAIRTFFSPLSLSLSVPLSEFSKRNQIRSSKRV